MGWPSIEVVALATAVAEKGEMAEAAEVAEAAEAVRGGKGGAMDFREEIMIGSTTASECAAPAATEVTLAPMSRSRPTIRGVSARPRIPRKKGGRKDEGRRRKEGRRKGRRQKILIQSALQDYYTRLLYSAIHHFHPYKLRTPLYTAIYH